MNEQRKLKVSPAIDSLCDVARQLVAAGKYRECEHVLAQSMSLHPHAPQPHNLLGIVFEKKGDHVQAMKHFRAAWALDPTYLPARTNMEVFGTFYFTGKCAYDESDCIANNGATYETLIEDNGIKRISRIGRTAK